VKTLEKDTKKRKIDARKGILLASYAKKKTRKRKKTKTKSDASQKDAPAAAADSSKCSSPKEVFALMPQRSNTPQWPMELHIPGLDEHVPSRLPSPQPPHSTESSRARDADSEAKVTDHLHPNAVGEPKTINSFRD